ncbi:hypothetical protein D6833_12510, partial [Candidatus Parcubacteria bacterium]
LRLQGIQIMPIVGKEQLRPNLNALVLSPGFSQITSLSIVRDANANPVAAFQSVRDALRAANLPAPDHPLKIVGGKPRVAVLILPGENSPGMLEDLCLKAVAEDPAMFCVEQYFKCLEQKRLSLPDNMSKAKVQVFLASRPRADLRLGEAAEKGYWPWDHDAFQMVKDFINMLVNV